MIPKLFTQIQQRTYTSVIAFTILSVFIIPVAISLLHVPYAGLVLAMPATPPVTSLVTSPGPTNTPTPTKKPTPTIKPTMTPKPTKQPKPNSPPVIKTSELKKAKKGHWYFDAVIVEDKDNDEISVAVSNFPPGLSRTVCFTVHSHEKTTVTCIITGMPTKIGEYKIQVTAKDSVGHAISRLLSLRVSK